MKVATFVHRNVLVDAHDSSDHIRHVITRTFDPPLSRREARALVDAYAAWPVVQVDPTSIVAASALEEQHSLSLWDALDW